MKKIIYVLLFVFLFSFNIVAQDGTVVIDVFKEAPILFGNLSNGENWEVEGSGRIISRKVKLPEFKGPVKITARLTLESEGDPWDRFGSVYLVQEDSADIELVKFMTGFGVGLPYKRDNIPDHPSVAKWAENVVWEQDLSELASLLKGEVTIKAIIDTWVNPAWLIDFQLVFEPQVKGNNPEWVFPLLNSTAKYWTSDKFTEKRTRVEVTIPEGLSSVKMYYYTSGHGGQSTGDEFNKKNNLIYIDDQEVLRFIPWRDDGILYRSFNPTSGKFDGGIWSSDLSRSNWIPGNQLRPMIFELGEYLTPGKHTIRFFVEDMAESTPDNLNYWNISAFLTGSKEDVANLAVEGIIPYLQTPTPNSIYVCWPYNDDFSSFVEYGITKDLGNIAQGNNEIIGDTIVWHNVKLKNLEPDTVYYYKVISGRKESKIYSFKTLVANGLKKGHIRVGIIGGNQGNKDISSKLIKAIQDKMTELYGEDLTNEINLILNTGNIVEDGLNIEQYRSQFFNSINTLSPNLPILIMPGDSDKESIYLYQFLKNDGFGKEGYSKLVGKAGEEYFKFQMGRALFIVYNSNVLKMDQLKFFDQIIRQADKDEDIDYIFVLDHQPIYNKSKFVKKKIVSSLNKTNKPVLFINGQVDGYEHGMLSNNDIEWIVIGGVDGLAQGQKSADIELQKVVPENCYGILDIDLENKGYIIRIYSMGSKLGQEDDVLVDKLSYELRTLTN